MKCFKFLSVLFFAFVFHTGVQAQENLTIKGKILDTDGNPIPGASVLIKGTIMGTTTDIEGDYTLRNVPKGTVLQFSFIGYVTQEVIVESKTTINVIMLEDTKSLEEVTIVAFGTQKKESVLASITTISPKNLRGPSSNLTQSFAGQMAGMISYQTSGEPGADNASFFIRGVTSFGYNVEPLILIDNIEVSQAELARLQPDDIESFSIMKDAAATALYGARGANGVILIKTKEGSAGKMQLSIRLENTFSKPTMELKLADPITYMHLHNEALITRGLSPLYTDEKIERTAAGIYNPLIYPATDWRSELMKKVSINQRVSVNVKGGGNIARYFVSASLSQDNGMLKVDKNNNFNNNIDLKIYTLRSNVNIDLTKTTEMKVSLAGTFEDYNGPLGSGAQMYQLIMRSNPVQFPAKYPIDEEHKYVNHTMFGNAESGDYLNPYAQMVRGYKDGNKSNMSAQLELNQKLDFITKGLFVRALFNTKRESDNAYSRFYNPYYYVLGKHDAYTGEYHVVCVNPDINGNSLMASINGLDIKTTTYFESAAVYNSTFAQKHDVGAQLIYTMRTQTVPPFDEQREGVLSSLPYRNIGLAGRFSYGYDGRYLAELNFGYNASERFSKQNRWGFFPSISAGWVVSNEDFFASMKETITLLKFRTSYGLAGNDKISSSRFLYLSDVSLTNSSYGYSFGMERSSMHSRPGMSISRYADQNITWEVSTKANFAVELTLFKDMAIIWELFSEKRNNILQTRATIPYSMGLWATPQANLGKSEGKGTEFSIDYKKSFNKDLWIQGRVNFTYATSKYTQFEDYDYQKEWWRKRTGHSTSQRFGYLAEGLFIDDADVVNSPRHFGNVMAGDIKYRDLNGDEVISDLDMAPIGYPETPEINYGFGISAGYKGWDFSFFFNGLSRRSFQIDYRNVNPFANTWGSGNSASNALAQFIADNHWSEDNRNPYAVWPRLKTFYDGTDNNVSGFTGYNSSGKANSLIGGNTWFMRDGAFLRLKSIEIGYTMPDRLVRRAKMTGLRVYLTGGNLFTVRKFKEWDPEMAGNGLGYPLQRTFNIGVNVTF